ncbi:MAG: sugar phosphate isomerase/epimerase [Kiritimatiellae bacterium]|nr:sugar phosphate isomerase/epimerase [Kiritimatiellia bacterium]
MIKLTLFITTPDVPHLEECGMPQGDLEESVKFAKALGYDGVEVLMGDPFAFDAAGFRKILDRHGMTISAINSGGINYMYKESLVHADAKKAARALAKLKKDIEHCAALGCLQQAGVSRGFAIEGMPIHRFYDTLAGVLRKAADHAKKHGVKMAVEYTNRFEINTLNNLEEALALIRRIRRPNVGLLLDTYHSFLEDPDVYKALEKAGRRLWYVHLHDSDRGPAAASKGELDFEKIVRVLKKIGYKGCLADGLVTTWLPEKQIRKSTAALKRLLRKHGL